MLVHGDIKRQVDTVRLRLVTASRHPFAAPPPLTPCSKGPGCQRVSGTRSAPKRQK